MNRTATRDFYQRRAYATRRATLAVDRMILAKTLDEKFMAGRWAQAWGAVARLPAARQNQGRR